MATARKDLTDPRVQGPHGQDEASDVITVDELSRRLDIPKGTLYNWRYRGIGPRGHRVGKHLRYRWSDVLAWIDGLD